MEGVHSHATIQGTQRHRTHGSRSGMPSNNLGNALAKDLEPSVKTQVGLLTETLETWSLLRYGTWPQLMCCALLQFRSQRSEEVRLECRSKWVARMMIKTVNNEEGTNSRHRG